MDTQRDLPKTVLYAMTAMPLLQLPPLLLVRSVSRRREECIHRSPVAPTTATKIRLEPKLGASQWMDVATASRGLTSLSAHAHGPLFGLRYA